MSSFPAHYGMNFTPTIHADIPANIDPTRTTLPKPFVVVVTGAGKGLGYALAMQYAKAGASGISISSRTQSDLDKLEDELQSIKEETEVLKTICDALSEPSVRELEESVRQKWGRVDTVIANAGVISRYVEKGESGSNLPIGIIDDNDWSRVLHTNLLGSWSVAKAFMPLLIQTKDGPQTLIINTSLASHSANSQFTPIAYNVSKIAVNRLVEHIDNDHGQKDGIHAYALHPGGVVTPQTTGHEAADGAWGNVLTDDEGLAGAFSVWLSKQKRSWLSGRYLSCTWDVDALERMKDEIVKRDLLKFRMVV